MGCWFRGGASITTAIVVVLVVRTITSLLLHVPSTYASICMYNGSLT